MIIQISVGKVAVAVTRAWSAKARPGAPARCAVIRDVSFYHQHRLLICSAVAALPGCRRVRMPFSATRAGLVGLPTWSSVDAPEPLPGAIFFLLKGIMPSPWTERALVFFLSLFFLFFSSFFLFLLQSPFRIHASPLVNGGRDGVLMRRVAGSPHSPQSLHAELRA